MSNIVKIEVLENGFLPIKKRKEDAGMDVHATSDFILKPGEVVKHPLLIKIELPSNSYMSVEPRSSLAIKGFFTEGVIDELYRGVPHVIAANVSSVPIEIKRGDRIAQLILHPYDSNYVIEQVSSINTDTSRGEGGFGSTNKN